MSKKKKAGAEEPDGRPPLPPKVGTSMKGLLASVKLGAPAKPKIPAPTVPVVPMRPPPKRAPAPKPASAIARPSEGLRGHERTAYFDAMAGVRGLGTGPGAPPPRASAIALPPAPPAPEQREGERAARARLAALVSEGLRFEVRREDDWQAGVRAGAPRGTLERLADATPAREATLDLHGAREAEVEARVARFVRDAARRGVRRVRIIHGKGLHSDRGGPVLGDAVIGALTKGAAAARVIAFVTAPSELGGSGALLVELGG